jgi:hypothetical protein
MPRRGAIDSFKRRQGRAGKRLPIRQIAVEELRTA